MYQARKCAIVKDYLKDYRDLTKEQNSVIGTQNDLNFLVDLQILWYVLVAAARLTS